MDKQFQLDIITSERAIYHGIVSSLVVSSALGYMGILANHAALIANLIPGKLFFKEGPSENFKQIDSKVKGFIEVIKNNVTILLDES